MQTSHDLVSNLLTYIEKVELAGRKPPFQIDAACMLGWGVGFSGLPGVELGDGAEGAPWLSVKRQSKNSPPELPASLVDAVALGESAEREPALFERIDPASARGAELQAVLSLYLVDDWRPWAATERPRREAIKLYQRLFALGQALTQDAGDAPMELLCGMGMHAWRVQGRSVLHPLITQACVVEVSKSDFSIKVHPSGADPRMELEIHSELGISGLEMVEAEFKQAMSLAAESDERLSPFSVELLAKCLSPAARALSSDGALDLGSAHPGEPAEALRVSSGWCLYSRKRQSHFLLADLARLRSAISALSSEGKELPGFAKAFVELAEDHAGAIELPQFRGMSSGSDRVGASDLYFPLPYNQEQERIIRELERSSGVVVQGPPGTGKTHTIANVVSHYLACGKRVLVTAKGETALSVVRDKLPEDIAKLCVALLTDEADGLRQFELSASTIAGEVASLDEAAELARMKSAKARIDELHAKIALIDARLSELARGHLESVDFMGEPMSAGEIASALERSRSELGWLPHGKMPSETIMVEQAWVDQAVGARLHAGADLPRSGDSDVDSASLASSEQIASAHQALLFLGSAQAKQVGFPLIAALDDASSESAKSMLSGLASAAKVRAEQSVGQAWPRDFERELSMGDSVAKATLDLAGKILGLEAKRGEAISLGVEHPEGAMDSEAYLEEIDRRSRGGGSGLFGAKDRSDAGKFALRARVEGRSPKDDADWGKVVADAKWRLDAKRRLSAFGAACSSWFEPSWSASGEAGAQLGKAKAAALAMLAIAGACQSLARSKACAVELFGQDLAMDASEESLSRIKALAQQAFGLAQAKELAKSKPAWMSRLSGMRGLAVDSLRCELASLGDPSVSAQDLCARWEDSLALTRRLASLRPCFWELEMACSKIKAAGAAQWAQALGEQEEGHDFSKWSQAWAWRAWSNKLQSLDAMGSATEMLGRRAELEADLGRACKAMAVSKAWLGAKAACTPRVAQALGQYLNAVRSMGKGTGVRAARHRRAAREAMSQAHKAIPCWIMPQWRVSEAMGSEIGMFDLVVVDEASQSDIWALPALLRGAKILVVGDHRQVSPSAVGIAEESVRDVADRFLGGQPHRSELAAGKSIYDLASVVFAGSAVMLREHFRCVPSIIEFSNQAFYGGRVRPLRSPKLGEVKGAPLVDIWVKDGFRDADKNPAEARAIVDAIKALIADPSMGESSIGVVTLLGTEQSTLISKMIHEEIDPAEILRRQIVAGTPSMFQGRERDAMFISMVIERGDKSYADRLDMEQRINVAMTRARDRAYLVRSVEASDVKAGSLAHRLISHFRQPFAQDPATLESARALCESGFEQEMFDELATRGYRIQPQFPCGGYRIDFVVEGADGSRLAIECDGDRYHGPERWGQDMERQRVLERSGWTFWRCFASSFQRSRQGCMDSLEQALAQAGVFPCSSAWEPSMDLVERREVVALAGPAKH